MTYSDFSAVSVEKNTSCKGKQMERQMTYSVFSALRVEKIFNAKEANEEKDDIWCFQRCER